MKKNLLFIIMLLATAAVFAQSRPPRTQTGNATQEMQAPGLSAAHNSLPIGSKARIRSPSNGREIVVTITERIPTSTRRIIDLSPAAAYALELGFGGPVIVTPLATVAVLEPVWEPEPEPPQASSEAAASQAIADAVASAAASAAAAADAAAAAYAAAAAAAAPQASPQDVEYNAQVIPQIVAALSADIPRRVRLAIVGIESPSPEEATFYVNELTIQFVNLKAYTVLERGSVDAVLKEQNFQMTYADEQAMVSIGKFIGARVVITGSITGTGARKRMIIKAIDVLTAEILSIIPVSL